MKQAIFKMDSFNFVPFKRTPWGGKRISELKRRYFPENENIIPEKIGESWEISTDYQFPSHVQLENLIPVTLDQFLLQNGKEILGTKVFNNYGNHSPLLLKWLNADDLLSVQLHPTNDDKMLKSNECGKPESWFVFDVEKDGFVYLGFKDGLSKDQITQHLLNDELDQCLYKYYPKNFDYISVPAGCVHAVGTGVFLAEPQYVLPKKSGKTWRISDWRRLYDEQGNKSENGSPRELHVKESLQAIDWNLPRGKQLENLLIRRMENEKPFLGDKHNPFALQIFMGNGEKKYKPLISSSFSIVTVWAGKAVFHYGSQSIMLRGGESAFISAKAENISIQLQSFVGEEGALAFFALNDEVL